MIYPKTQWEKRIKHIHRTYVAHIASLKTLNEKPLDKRKTHKEKSTMF